MTEKIESAIEQVKWHKVDSTCDIQVNTCDLIIRSLQAWEEVLTELENMREIIWQDTDSDARIVRANAWDKNEILVKAIDIINQKLKQVEE